MRLNKSDREFLIRQVKETVFDDKEKAKYEKGMKELAQKVYDRLIEKYPPKDMIILEKYRHAQVYNEASVWYEYKHIKLRFPKPISAPQSPDLFVDARNTLIALVAAMERANACVRKPYMELITASVKWEQVVESWPAAKKWIPARGDVALIAITKEDKDFVKKDSAKREWREK